MADMSSYLDPLTKFAEELQPMSVLEIGIGFEGFSTGVWLANTRGQVTSVDKGDWNGAPERLAGAYPARFKFIQGRSEEVIPTITEQFDLIYIDGDHAYEGVKADILNCMPLVKPGGILLLDDYGVDVAAIDVVDGHVIDGKYGVKEAADEVITWPRAYEHIAFANGGVAYVAP